MKDIDTLSINTIRLLSADSVQQANSGHPGLPLGAAPAVYTLWSYGMKHNPANPYWPDRDRFVLSAGHGSALLYSMLHIFGYDLSIDDIKNFRQFDSKAPGHPEFGHTVGVEITTGPLGQGIANATGMALAENYLANRFNRPDCKIVDHYTFILCGDGCLMEGISSEAASLAGTLGLNRLILLYDSNNITIEGSTDITFREDVLKRFEAYGWQTLKVEDGNNPEAIKNAINEAKSDEDRPTIIEIKTKIGFGSPNKQGKSGAHGEPLGLDELKLTKQAFGFDPEQSFFVPEEVRTHAAELGRIGADKESEWNNLVERYKALFPEDYEQWEIWHRRELPVDLLNNEDFWHNEGNLATRVSSEKILNRVAKLVPNLIGGSADLAPSTKTVMAGRSYYGKENPSGSNLHFGIREHAMAAMANGIAVHGGLRVYIAGFFVFSDYMKPSMRLAAMMKLPVINILTHDSIGVGEDGPTHQPVEQLAALRSIPNMTVIRPCDSNETSCAWYSALTRVTSPTAIVLSRQNLTLLDETSGKGALKGAYVLRDSEKAVPDMILMASGSEVELIYKAQEILKQNGIDARVVSMPSWEIFEEQSDEYKESVIPRGVRKRLAVEAASSFGWHKYVGLDGAIISIDTFGASAPANILLQNFGFDVDNIVKKCMQI